MSAKSIELRSKRAQIVKDSRDLLNVAQTEKRSLTAEESAKWDTMMAEVDRIKAEVDKEERTEALELEVAALSERRMAPKPGETTTTTTTTTETPRRETDEYRSMFRTFLREGFRGFGAKEHRALQSDLDTTGGYLAAPTQWIQELIKFVDDQTWALQLATVIDVTEARSLGVPSLDADPADADWTAEIFTGAEDSTMAFGKRELSPKPLAKRIKVSNKLLRLVPSAENLVLSRLGYKFGITIDKSFNTGDGIDKPLGVFTASANGISTGRDTNTAGAGVIAAEDLMTVKYSLKPQYWPQAKWLMHRNKLRDIRKLKTSGSGEFLWQVGGLTAGLDSQAPDNILGVPVAMSEYSPTATTTGTYACIVGNFKFYWIARALGFGTQRLDELYAEANQTGFIGRTEIDGMPVLEEAFSRLAYT